MDNEDNLMPRIVVDKNAKEYVETDDEEEGGSTADADVDHNPLDRSPEPPKVVKDLPRARNKKEIFQGVDEEEVEEVVKPKPTRKPRKPPSQQQLDHLAKIRVKAQEAKKKMFPITLVMARTFSA